MDLKWSVRSKDKEPPREKEPAVSSKPAEDPPVNDYRNSAKHAIEMEVRTMIEEEIKSAAKELADEQKRAIREAVEEHKRIIAEVLEQEKLAIRAQKEDLRETIIRRGMG